MCLFSAKITNGDFQYGTETFATTHNLVQSIETFALRKGMQGWMWKQEELSPLKLCQEWVQYNFLRLNHQNYICKL